MANASDPKRKRSMAALVSWIVGFLVVAVAVLVGFSELGAHQQCDNSFQAIGAAIGKKKVSKEQVARFLDGSPTRHVDKDKRHELFTWGGTLQSYGFQLEYDQYGDVKRIEPK